MNLIDLSHIEEVKIDQEPPKTEIEIESSEAIETPSKPVRRRRYKFYAFFILSGLAIGGLQYGKMRGQDPLPYSPQKPKFSYQKASQRDPELHERVKDERILKIRQSLQQELEQEFQDLPENYDQKLVQKQREIKDDINKILGFENITEPEKYAEISAKIMQVQEEIKQQYDLETTKQVSIKTELERLEKLKLIIDSEIYSLKCEFEEAVEAVDNHRVNLAINNLFRKQA